MARNAAKKVLPAAVQFHQNIDTIREMKSQHYPVTMIWEKLNDEGLYDHPYSHFAKLVKKHITEVKNNGGTKPKNTSNKESTKTIIGNKTQTGNGPKIYTSTLDKHS